jgi:hypothetical protein
MKQARPDPQDPIRLLKRSDQSLVFQLRTGQAPVNGHLHSIDQSTEDKLQALSFQHGNSSTPTAALPPTI